MLKRLVEDWFSVKETHHERIMKSNPNRLLAVDSRKCCLFLMQMHPPSPLAMTWAKPSRIVAASPWLKASFLGFLLHPYTHVFTNFGTTWNRKYVEQFICIFGKTSTAKLYMNISFHFTSAIPDSEPYQLEWQVVQQQRPLPWPKYRPETHSFAPFLLQIRSYPKDFVMGERKRIEEVWIGEREDGIKETQGCIWHILATDFSRKLLSFL